MLDTLPETVIGRCCHRATLRADRLPQMTVVKHESMFSRRMSPEVLPSITLIE
jgi:hypothetical protein